MTKVTIDKVRKLYPNGAEAVKSSSFGIEDGEFAVLVGPSGCGKSTLLRMVAGLEKITEGSVSIGDRIVNDVDPAERDIAMVFQNYALYPHMSVYKNMAYGLKNRGIDKTEIDKAVQKAAAMLDIAQFLDRKPSQLSGGQRQRVAMGRAIVRNPALFLFDEPLSNLDAKLRNQMRIEIRKLQRELGVTSIYVTHDQVEAMTMADKIIVLNDGRIEQVGTPAEIYHAPQSTFVAGFMGAPPMNFLPGTYNGNGRIDLAGIGALPVRKKLDASGNVQVGIRPESVTIGSKKSKSALAYNLEFVEELGAVRLLHGHLGDHRFIAHVPHSTEIPEGSLYANFAADAVHVFDPASGARLS